MCSVMCDGKLLSITESTVDFLCYAAKEKLFGTSS